MTDRQFLRLNDKWAVAYDANQWILQKRKGKRWASVSYVASKKRVLMRVIASKGIEATPDAVAALRALPETFRAFIEGGPAPAMAEAAE